MQWLFSLGAILIVAAMAAIAGTFFVFGLLVWVAFALFAFVATAFKRKPKYVPATPHYPADESVQSLARITSRVVDQQFAPAVTDKRELVPASFVYPVLPAGHDNVAREYVTAGVAVGLTLMHKGKPNVFIHPAVINRFADAESAYSALGYRAVDVETFMAFAKDESQMDGIKLGVLRSKDEPLVQFAGGLRRSLRKAYAL